MDIIYPEQYLQGISGHIWEQLYLPMKTENKLLWSPANTGPLGVSKQVLSLMDVTPLDHPEWMSLQFAGWYGFLIPRLVRNVRKIITISEYSKQRILEHCSVDERKIEVTYLAADERFVPEVSEKTEEVLKILKIPSRHYLVALGSLEPRKNLHRVLQAWENIQNTIPKDIWLILAGGVGKKNVFGDHRYNTLPERVYLTGHVPDQYLPALYSGAIATVYLSLYEGFGLPPLEAMACGTPVLTSNISSLPEVVGDAALMVNPFDIEDISEGMKLIIENSTLRNTMKKIGLKRAHSFNWNVTAKKTIEILSSAQ
jgi:glycosyltransferase involved in cell wall biosynthesis